MELSQQAELCVRSMILFNTDLVNKKVKRNIPTDKNGWLKGFFFFFFFFFGRVTPFIILKVISLLGCAIQKLKPLTNQH